MLKRLLLLILITFLGVTAFFSYGFLVGTKEFEIEQTTLTHSAIPKSLHFEKIAVFSDIYLDNNYRFEQLETAVSALNAQKPAMIFFLGDLIAAEKFPEVNQQELIALLSKLQAPAGKFFTLGEQDLANKAEIISLFEQAGFIYLTPNTVHSLYYKTLEPIEVAAFDPQSDTATIQATLSTITPDKFTLMLNHFPDSFETTKQFPTVEVQLSGHSLGGQINIPGLRNLLAPAQGQKYPVSTTVAEQKLFVSRGLGNQSELPIRLFNAPSIQIYTLEKATVTP